MCGKSQDPAHFGQLYHKRKENTKKNNEDSDQSL